MGSLAVQHSAATRCASTDHQHFPPLELVDRPAVPTEQAAFYLMRRPQTMRGWASADSGPLRPLRINGRLAWPVADIRKLLGVQ